MDITKMQERVRSVWKDAELSQMKLGHHGSVALFEIVIPPKEGSEEEPITPLWSSPRKAWADAYERAVKSMLHEQGRAIFQLLKGEPPEGGTIQ